MTTRRLAIVVASLAVLGAAALTLRDRVPGAEDDWTPSARTGVYAFDLFEEDERLHLLLVDYEASRESPVLLYLRSDDGGERWSAAARVDAGATPAYVPYRGVDPQVAAKGDDVVAVWTTAGDDLYGYGTGPLATAVSSDGGKTWTPGPNPADDGGLTTAHEFIDVLADAEGRLHLIWIDDRDHDKGIRRGLRYARSVDGGSSWSAHRTLDEQICGCCWTHLRTDPAGRLYVLYRDEHPDPSDMKLLASDDGGRGWLDLGYVGAFAWMEKGCPHTTAGLTVLGARDDMALHAMVQTKEDDVVGVHHLKSRDRGESWSPPSKIAGEGAHYSDLAADGSRLGVIWQGQVETRTVIYGRLSEDSGKRWSEPIVLSDPAVSSSYPRIAGGGEGFRVFWIESEDGLSHRWNSVLW